MSPRAALLAPAFAALLAASSASADLAGSEWVPIAFESGKVEHKGGAFVNFGGEGALRGVAGCAHLAGRFQVAMRGWDDKGALEVGKGLEIAIERRAPLESEGKCSEAEKELEQLFLGALDRARSYARHRADLVLYDESGRPIAHLKQTDWD